MKPTNSGVLNGKTSPSETPHVNSLEDDGAHWCTHSGQLLASTFPHLQKMHITEATEIYKTSRNERLETGN